MIELDELPSLITIANYVWCHEFLIFISRKGLVYARAPTQAGAAGAMKRRGGSHSSATFDAEYKERANMPAIHGANDALPQAADASPDNVMKWNATGAHLRLPTGMA